MDGYPLDPPNGRAWETEFNPLRELGKIATVCWAPGQVGAFRGIRRLSHDRNFTLA